MLIHIQFDFVHETWSVPLHLIHSHTVYPTEIFIGGRKESGHLRQGCITEYDKRWNLFIISQFFSKGTQPLEKRRIIIRARAFFACRLDGRYGLYARFRHGKGNFTAQQRP